MRYCHKNVGAWSLSGIIGAVTLFPGAAIAGNGPTYERDDNRYLYALTAEKAAYCAALQNAFSVRQKNADPEWSRRHKAMALTWQQLVRDLAPDDGPLITKAANPDEALNDQLDAQENPLAALVEHSQVCEVTAAVNGLAYNGAAFVVQDTAPAIFADSSANKNQSGLKNFPEPPTKNISFGAWEFAANGNSCRAVHTFADGAVLTLGFTNFFDGSLSFEWDQLPRLDAQSEGAEGEYEAMMAKHRAGYETDEDNNPIIKNGYTFATYPGTAFFADDRLVTAPFGEGMSDGQKYVFGPYVQSNYYNLLPLARELIIKVLGKETHRVKLDNPAMWNEISNCMAQYPYG